MAAAPASPALLPPRAKVCSPVPCCIAAARNLPRATGCDGLHGIPLPAWDPPPPRVDLCSLLTPVCPPASPCAALPVFHHTVHPIPITPYTLLSERCRSKVQALQAAIPEESRRGIRARRVARQAKGGLHAAAMPWHRARPQGRPQGISEHRARPRLSRRAPSEPIGLPVAGMSISAWSCA